MMRNISIVCYTAERGQGLFMDDTRRQNIACWIQVVCDYVVLTIFYNIDTNFYGECSLGATVKIASESNKISKNVVPRKTR